MSSLLQLPATISKASTLSNRVIRLWIDSQENMTDEQMSAVFAKIEKLGWFCFLEDSKISEEDVLDLPELPKDESDKISPTQRLRNRLFVYYKETHKDESKFNEWFADTVDRLGQKYLDKLNN